MPWLTVSFTPDRFGWLRPGELLARSRSDRGVHPVGFEEGFVPTRRLHAIGLRSWHLHTLSIGSVGLCVGLWMRAKTVDQDERGNAERRALFVGLWPPTIWLIGDSLTRHE